MFWIPNPSVNDEQQQTHTYVVTTNRYMLGITSIAWCNCFVCYTIIIHHIVSQGFNIFQMTLGFMCNIYAQNHKCPRFFHCDIMWIKTTTPCGITHCSYLLGHKTPWQWIKLWISYNVAADVHEHDLTAADIFMTVVPRHPAESQRTFAIHFRHFSCSFFPANISENGNLTLPGIELLTDNTIHLASQWINGLLLML